MYMLYIQASLYSVCCDVRGGGGGPFRKYIYTVNFISFYQHIPKGQKGNACTIWMP